MLLHEWETLTGPDLHEIRNTLELLLRKGDRASLDVGLAICALLSTGRKLCEIANLRVVRQTGDVKKQSAGLLHIDGRWFWQLPAGRPRQPAKLSQTALAQTAKVQKHVRLPVTKLTTRFIEEIWSPATRARKRIFQTPKQELALKINETLRARRPGWAVEPRRAARTVAALERWLTRAMLHSPGGDHGITLLVTARDEGISRTQAYYGGCNVSNAMAVWEHAVREFDDLDEYAKDDPEVLAGGSYLPSDNAVRALAKRLRTAFNAVQNDRIERHDALTNYTVALLSFAIGHRGNHDELPSSAAIDEKTGFCRVHDKGIKRQSEARLAWLPEIAIRQIRTYERHLRELQEVLGPLPQFERGRLPLFALDGRRLRIVDIWKRIDGWHLPRGAQRQWIRSKLVHRCSGETVDAFMGHWQLGTEPWVLPSCLDPLVYRAELQHALDHVLENGGWVQLRLPLESDIDRVCSLPQLNHQPKAPVHRQLQKQGQDSVSSNAPSKQSLSSPSPFYGINIGDELDDTGLIDATKSVIETLENDDDDEVLIGQALASAILNGVLLDRLAWPGWLASLPYYDPETTPWLNIYFHKQTKCRRWQPDPTTAHLLSQMGRTVRNRAKILDAESCLKAFFECRLGESDPSALERFHRYAGYFWLLRLPPLLVDYAKGTISSTAIPQARWSRAAGSPLDNEARRFRKKPANDDGFKRYNKECREVQRCLWGPFENYLRGRCGLPSAKNSCADLLARQIASSVHKPSYSGTRLLLEWCLEMVKEKRARPNPKGLSPMTVQAYFIAIRFGLYGDKQADEPFMIDIPSLIARRDKALDGLSDAERETVSTASRRLKRFLRTRGEIDPEASQEGGAPNADQDLVGEPGDAFLGRRVYADLVTPEEYSTALELCAEENDGEEHALMLILGFRTGLRLNEANGLKLSDFQIGGDQVKLEVRPHKWRQLKTFNSRRVIPLDILLEPEELARLTDWVAMRRRFAETRGSSIYCFGSHRSRVPSLLSERTKVLDAILTRAAERHGNARNIVYHHLRHSFASYLLATLLLPWGVDDGLIPKHLRPVVSSARRARVSDSLVGANRPGQFALSVVRQLLGHTGPEMTWGTYVHLLDLSLHCFICTRKSGRDIAVSLDNATAFQSAPPQPMTGGVASTFAPGATEHNEVPPSPVLRNKRPAWPVLHAFATAKDRSNERGVAPLLDASKFRVWRATYQDVRLHCLPRKHGVARELIAPQGPDAEFLVDELWRAFPDPLSDQDRVTVQNWIKCYDIKDHAARFPNRQQACDFVHFLRRVGIQNDELRTVSGQTYDKWKEDKKLKKKKIDLSETGAASIAELLEAEEDGSRTTIILFDLSSKWEESYKIQRSGKRRHQPDRAMARKLHHALRVALLMLAICEGLTIAPRRKRPGPLGLAKAA